MKKHAYIILAHHAPDVLRTLLRMIRDPRNDVFLHVDSRTQALDGLLDELRARKDVTILPRRPVFFMEQYVLDNVVLRKPLTAFREAARVFQQVFRLNRTWAMEVRNGDQWASLTEPAVDYRTMADLPRLAASKNFFARKFPADNPELVRAVEKMVHDRVQKVKA